MEMQDSIVDPQDSAQVVICGILTQSVTEMFEQLVKNNFSSYSGVLHCGNLSAPVTLSPPPQVCMFIIL